MLGVWNTAFKLIWERIPAETDGMFNFSLNRWDEKCPLKEKLLQVKVMVDGMHFSYKLGGIYLYSNFFLFNPRLSVMGL